MTVTDHYTLLMRDAEADLDAAGVAWIEKRAAGKDCHKEEAAIKEAERAYRKLERRKNRLESKARRKRESHGSHHHTD